MTFQTVVNRNFTQGFVGDFFKDGPNRTRVARITSPTVATDTITTNRVGRAFTWTGEVPPGSVTGNSTQAYLEGTVAVGGTGVFAGILVNPKHYALYGSQTSLGLGPLSASMDLPQYAEGEFCFMGFPNVEIFNDTAATKTVNFGDLIFYVTASLPNTEPPIPVGGLITYPTVASLPSGLTAYVAQIPGATVQNPTSLAASTVGAVGTGVAISTVTAVDLLQ